MTQSISRRRFLRRATAAGIAASATLGWATAARADYMRLTYYLHGEGWDDYGRRQIVGAAMDLVGSMGNAAVLGDAYRRSDGSYYLTGGTWDRTDPNSHYSGLGYTDVLRVQVSNLSVANLAPVVHIHPYYSEGQDWGRANYDLVSVKFAPNTFVVEGEFSIQLNHRRLGGNGNHSSPAAWAGVICHEMLHNLGHMHDVGDYRTSLQINALQQAVYVQGQGNEDIVAARHFQCGGRVE